MGHVLQRREKRQLPSLLLAWVGIADPDIYFQLFHSDSVPPNGDNRGLYGNPGIDRLLEAGRATVDPAQRKPIYGRVQNLLAEDLPYVPLWWWKNVVVQAPSVQGIRPLSRRRFISFKNVSLRCLHVADPVKRYLLQRICSCCRPCSAH